MEEPPATVPNSGNDGAPLVANVGGDGDDGGSIGDSDRSSAGNRWPKQETLALIRIRSEMDAVFRDSNLKGPLWDEVSRKLSELGYHRSGKKCREKFENVYKYHRRTKDGRSMKSDKMYRFSDQLQALESNNRGLFGSPAPLAVKPPAPVFVAMGDNASVASGFNGTATGHDQVQNNVSPISVAAPAVGAMPPPPVVNNKRSFPFSTPDFSGLSDSGTSSDSSDDEPPRKKKKWEDFFGKLMKEVIAKQEELQMKFLETLDRRERDRVAKEEAWRAQEIAKMNEEHDRLAKERSLVAAKDAAVVAFLQKLVGKSVDAVPVVDDEPRKKPTDIPEQQIQQTQSLPTPPPPPSAQQPLLPPPREIPMSIVPPVSAVPPSVMKTPDSGTRQGDNNILSPSPSRWPKAEISTLITLRTQLDGKYQENVPKGPLWEEISAAMRNHGYNRNAKRCKEKWENINKYYKKIKESNKRRPEDSKTCPYFDQLDAIYREKSTPIVAQPEQQWPPPASRVVGNPPSNPPPQHWPAGTNVVQMQKDGIREMPPSSMGQAPEPPRQPRSSVDMEDQGSEEYDDFDDDDDSDDGDEDKEDEHGVYEIVASKMSSMTAV